MGKLDGCRRKEMEHENVKQCSADGFSQSAANQSSESAIVSINLLARQVPECVLKLLCDEALFLEESGHKNGGKVRCDEVLYIEEKPHRYEGINEEMKSTRIPMSMPHTTLYKAALLFIDMSGFTKLSQMLDIEDFSKSINSYFQTIVHEVCSRGGDILKFAGDAIFAEWRVGALCEGKRSQKMSVGDCVQAAALCGATVVRNCADYPIYEKSRSILKGKKITNLNVHCGLGVGKMGGVHVGNDHTRRLYLVIGDPIDQAAEACDSAELGEFRASLEALKYLDMKQPHKKKKERINVKESKLIASRQHIYIREKTNIPLRRSCNSLTPSDFSIPFDRMNVTSLEMLQSLLSLYVHRGVLGDDLVSERSISIPGSPEKLSFRGAKSTHRRTKSLDGNILYDNINVDSSLIYSRRASLDGNSARDLHRSDAELRDVCTIFIKPNIRTKLTNDSVKNKDIFMLLHNVMNVVLSVIEHYKGDLLQYLMDDKGVVMIATFGLRGSTFPHMVAERALPTCRIIHGRLQRELGVESQLGATLGKVYCGVVGGDERHAFTVLGSSVNLSARLMAQKSHPGILVDIKVRSRAKNVNFDSYPAVKAKGYTDPVPVFKPLTAKDTRLGKKNPCFVGRKTEIGIISDLVLDMSNATCPSKFLVICGDSGLGKSEVMVHAINKSRELLKPTGTCAIISRVVCYDGDTLVPFSLIRSILNDFLGEKQTEYNIIDIASHPEKSSTVADQLHDLCEDMDSPRELIEMAKHHLVGKSKHEMSKLEQIPELTDVLDFMAQIFINCTSHADIKILVLDDIQWIDNLSLKILQRIFEADHNVLIICSSVNSDFSKRDEFWTTQKAKYMDDNLYFELYLEVLEKYEVQELISKKLACENYMIDVEIINDVYMYSHGIPYVAVEILEHYTRNNLVEQQENKKFGWSKKYKQNKDDLQLTTVDQVMLQRLDGLSEVTRKILQLASVLGLKFSFRQIYDLSVHILSVPPVDINQHLIVTDAALDAAVEEGILNIFISEGESADEHYKALSSTMTRVKHKELGNLEASRILDCQIYEFRHSSWLRLISSVLLDSWKLDIHQHAAMVIEKHSPDPEIRDYQTNIELFWHWNRSENAVKAATVAIGIGQSFKNIGLNCQSIEVYQEALDMWRKHRTLDGIDTIAGYPPEVLNSIDETNLVLLIKIQTAYGQALGSTLTKDKKESAQAFKDAVTILENTPITDNIKDRAFIFPIYSGMFFLLKYGVMAKPSEYVSYETNLVTKFVNETKRHGDPIHYGRALAMQGEIYHRQGKFQDAIASHLKLKEVYNVEYHSALVAASYASDRVGQNFGCTANCYMRLGQESKALEVVNYIIDHLMPRMDSKNVHNSIVTIYPAIWILKDNGMADKAMDIFSRFVLKPFREYFVEDGSTPYLPAFKGIEILLDIVVYMEGKSDTFNEEYYNWALDLSNLEIKTAFDSSIGNFGRNSSSTNAEICLRLSKLTDDPMKKNELIKNGMEVAKQAICRCDGSDGSSKLLTAYCQIKPVYDELRTLVN